MKVSKVACDGGGVVTVECQQHADAILRFARNCVALEEGRYGDVRPALPMKTPMRLLSHGDGSYVLLAHDGTFYVVAPESTNPIRVILDDVL